MGRWVKKRFTLQPLRAVGAIAALAACVGVGLLALRELLPWAKYEPTLHVGISDCVIDYVAIDEPVCELYAASEEQVLRLAVDAQAGAMVQVEGESSDQRRGSRRPLLKPTPVDEFGRQNFEVRISSNVSALTISAVHATKGSLIGRKRIALRRVPASGFDREVLENARHYESLAQRQQILNTLDERLSKVKDDDAERLKLYTYSIGLRQSYWKTDLKRYGSCSESDERKLMSMIETAMSLAKHTKRIATTAHLLSFKFAFLRHRSDERTLIPELVNALPLLEPLPVERADLLSHLGELAASSKDMRSAIEYFAKAVEVAQWLGEPKLIDKKRSRLYRAQAIVGQDVVLSMKDDEERARSDNDRCEGSRRLNNMAWSRLMDWETSPFSKNRKDPLPLLREVIARSREHGVCPDRGRVQVVAASLARRLSIRPLDEDPREAAMTGNWRKELAEAFRLASSGLLDASKQLDIKQDLLFAQARLAVVDGDLKTAGQLFEQLILLTSKSGSVESQWEAVCGAARAQLLVAQTKSLPRSARLDQKRAFLRACTEVLEQSPEHFRLTDHARAVDARRNVVNRALSVLLRQDNQAPLPTIVETLRRVHRLSVAPHRSPRGSAMSEQLGQQLKTYLQDRLEFEVERAKRWPNESADPADAVSRTNAREQILTAYESLASGIHAQPEHANACQTLPALPEDELVVLCHAKEENVQCYTLLGAQTKSVSVPREAEEKDLAAKIFGPWRTALPPLGTEPPRNHPVRRVRVLGTGGLVHGDIAHWPLDGAPLIARLPVYESLDIMPVPQQEPGRSALFAVHPKGDLGAADETIEMVAKNMAGQPVQFFSGFVHNPPLVQLNKSPLFGPLMTAHQQAGLFAVIGHFEPALCSTDPAPFGAPDSPWLRALCLPGGNSIWPTDILLAERVPHIVLLLGCSSGRQDTSLSTSTVTLASAYVLRGSRAVLSATQDLPQALAEETLCYMTRNPRLLAADFDLPSALQQTQNALYQGKSCTKKYSEEIVRKLPWQVLRVTMS